MEYTNESANTSDTLLRSGERQDGHARQAERRSARTDSGVLETEATSEGAGAKSIASLLGKRGHKKDAAPHEKAASVNEIIALVGETKKYSRGYWLKKIGKKSFGEVMAIVKRAKDLPGKYPKGGYITNQLKAGQ